MLPSNVAVVLEEYHCEYQTEQVDLGLLIQSQQRSRDDKTVFALYTLVQTREGRIALIFSASAMVNLDTLAGYLGTEVQGIEYETGEQLLATKNLFFFPAIPQVYDVKTYIDPALLAAETVICNSGAEGLAIRMEQACYRPLVENCKVLDFVTQLDGITPNISNPDRDSREIENAVQSYTSLGIKKRLTETLEIPALSATSEKVLRISANPDADAEELVKVVDLDPSLSAQVVGWAASPYYSTPGKVTSIHDAIVRVLGFDLVLNLALGLAIGKTLSIPKDCVKGITPFWRQSVYCALTMEKLNRCLPPKKRGAPGLAYLTGLLNNFGYLILGHAFPVHSSVICRHIEVNRHLHPMYIEQSILGINRDQISSQLMAAWNLPSAIVTALRFQNDANFEGEDRVYANLCFIAKRLLAAKGIGDAPTEAIPPGLYTHLQLEPAAAEEVIFTVMDASEQIEAMTTAFSD